MRPVSPLRQLPRPTATAATKFAGKQTGLCVEAKLETPEDLEKNSETKLKAKGP
jgi:hypothetical protein